VDLTPGLRRPPDLPADEPLPESDPILVERIRAEIAERGPMTFARFMELALYDPERGYYSAAEARPGRAGDFITAPEAHPIFGRTLGRALDEMWRLLGAPDRFVVRDYGAGGGALAVAILGGLVADRSGLAVAIRYIPVEVNPTRTRELHERLAAAGLADRLASEIEAGPGCAIANEFLDALPVHRVEWREGRLRELYVSWDGGFVERAGPPSTPALGERLAAVGIALGEGQRAEICLGIDSWAAGVSVAVPRGFVLAIDYGHPADVLYGPERPDGTLRAYVRHRVHADPFRHVGRQDLTAHVDFTAVARALEGRGWRTLGLTSQAEFLVGSGAAEVAEALRREPGVTVEGLLALRSALARMVDPRATGGFRVLVAGRGLPEGAGLNGLGYRLRS
jgi:SAM-dependent MidA family methyltransferase